MVNQICRVITLIACCVAAVTLIDALASATSAPQQAAGAALAAAMAIIPYVFTRMVEGVTGHAEAEFNAASATRTPDPQQTGDQRS